MTDLAAAARSLESLSVGLDALLAAEPERHAMQDGSERGWFAPEEDDLVQLWFARYLAIREGLLQTIHELTPFADDTNRPADERQRAFLIGFMAAGQLVRGARYLLFEFATTRASRRKLDEGHGRIPRKQLTRVYRSLTHPYHAFRLSDAIDAAREQRGELEAIAAELGPHGASRLEQTWEALGVGVARYLKSRLRYRWYSWRRRRRSATRQGLFSVLEAFGRVIAEMRNPWHQSRVNEEVVGEIDALLQPGDVLVTRHDDAMSNLFLPGYWPHVALHIGPRGAVTPIDVDRDRADRWVDPIRILEARKDGVLLRELRDTLHVDTVAVIRPCIDRPGVAQAISQALVHEGKGYNFDFDFFTADRLVCTEVVYRAFHGVGPIEFELTRRSGRLTLSAEDLIAVALEEKMFRPVALFGAPGCENELVHDDRAAALLRQLKADA